MADLPKSPLPPPYDDEDTDALPPTFAYPRPPAPPTEEFSGPLPDALEGVDSGIPFDLPTIEEYERQQQAKPTYVNQPPAAPPTLPGTGGLDPNPDLTATSSGERTYASQKPVPPPADSTLLGGQSPYTRQAQSQPHTTQPAPRSTPPAPPAASPYRPERAAMPYQPSSGEVNPGLPRSAQGVYVPPPPAASVNPGLPPPSAARQKPSKRAFGLRPMTCLYAFIGLMVTLCGGSTVMILTAAALFIPRIEAQWESQLQRVDNHRAFETTFIYDRYGDVLFEAFSEGRRERVRYEQFPRDLINATVAIEDGTFWENPGINPAATLVALTQFLRASEGQRVAGGSTITQQLVRNVLFDFQKRAQISAARKAEEIILALLLTQRRSKQDILTLYLNEIYYGNLAYGAQTAARTFFNKDVQALTLGEAALLAGLPQAPADLDPLNPDPSVQERVRQRWIQVLNEMVKDGYITDAQRRDTIAQGLSFNPRPVSLKAPHFTIYAQREFERIMASLGYAPDEVARGGYRVYTTVDQNVNQMAQQVARDQVGRLTNQQVSNASVVVLKPLTGEIIGMVGSIDYNSTAIDGKVNVAIAFRQPGSTVKAFTYAAALERGFSPGAVIWDTPTEIGIPGQPLYVPRNYDGAFHGPMTMRFALANSYNIPAVQTLRLVGVDYLLSFLRRFGVESLNQDASQYGLSLTLGGGEITLMELTAGYAVFANQGNYVQPTSILCIADTQGRILYQYENGCLPQAGQPNAETVQRGGYGRLAVDPRIAYLITDILSDNAARSAAMGSNSPLRTDGIGTAVKTGTTNDFKDNWTVGYTRNVAVGVWVGNNDGKPMRNVSGLAGAAPIWNQVMLNIHNTPGLLNPFAINGQLMADKPEQPPGGMRLLQICDHRRLTDPATDCPRINEWFLDNPIAVPDLSGGVQYLDVPSRPAPSATMEEVSPDVYRALVLPLPPEYANAIQFQLGPGDKQPPPPKYCRVGEGMPADTPGVQALLFIAAPVTSQSDAAQAEHYARGRNLAFLPTIECTPDMVNLGYGAFGGAIVPPQDGMNITQIVSPFNGQVVTGDMPIIGTALFDMSQVNFYHLFIIGGPFSEWTYLGTEGRSSVVDGQLGTLNVGGLPSGTYGLRLALMRDGGQIVQPPFDITFVIP
ncbi:MAG: transglycosylase domain-containing protein [Anaerolineae bacterium]|nr:transglycosylase domain-containing protein [Anaerolineae bacterium]MDW8171920.1 transglycosylase domain-containing protein [Anaerolineae bacterium]